ncbi:hypothetical protein D1007_29832 [Hordeum vulgare]|nr:hypothetical protein D1007_29832 [Hordeum vulgare]
MGKKTTGVKGKQTAEAKTWAANEKKRRKEEAEKQRKGDVVFSRSNLDANTFIASNLGISNDKFHPALNRITRLKAVGLTIQHVGADFLRCRITPLQKRDMFAWEFNCPADWMPMYPGTVNNLTVYGHG